MKHNKLVLVGSGGHASVVLDAAQQMNRWSSFVVLDETPKGLVLSVDDTYHQRVTYKETCDFIVAIGDNLVRERKTTELLREGYSLATIIHPSAVVASSVLIEEGSCVFAGAILNPHVRIASGVIVNTSASIDHHSNIGSFAHVCPGAVLAGGVVVGDRCFVGAGAVISNQVSVTSDVTLGAGCVVIESIKESGTYVGVPARKL
jgi:sugar O-acyltransferase (sialic acid O-acetyltransferase NeuD family)